MGINAHRALYSAHAASNYLRSLTVDDEERRELRDARDEIRETLKVGFQDWSEFLDRREMFESVALASIYLYDEEPRLRPKFRMQGSWSYFTLNRTTIEPPQEIDLDDGVFLPVSFLTQNGSTHPAVVSDAYFSAVEAILAPLCADRGWTLRRDKPSCVRIEVKDGAHVDLALYAIPDQDFKDLVEKVEAAASLQSRFSDHEISFAEDVYPNLPSDHIMLAHRTEGWKPSDPRKLEGWFQDAVARHDEQLRRVCRYLKGWRDHNWESCRLSSIALMACVVTAYDQSISKPLQSRDDKALLMVAERLPELLNGRIENPVVDGQFLDEHWTPALRAEFVAQARALASNVARALAGDRPADARSLLTAALGDYMPANDDYYAVEEVGSPAIMTTGILKDIGNEPDARSAVKIGGDGRYG